MSLEPGLWNSDWTAGVRVWLEREGQPILDSGRLELLEAIDRWSSISRAARQIPMSYRHAWLLVQGMNEAAGEPLVTATTGGKRGGGAQLTPRGRSTLAIFRALQTQVERVAASCLARQVGDRDAKVIRLAAAVSLEDVLGQLLVDYALQQPRVQVRAIYGASDALADQVLTGTPTDLFLSADDRQMDRLEAASLIRSESRLTLAENTLMAIGPADQNHTVRRPADLLREGISRIAVAAPPCPLGVYTRAYLEHEGIYHSLQRRLLYVENSHSVLAAVRSGEVDIGLIYASDAGGGHETRLLFQARRPALPIRYTGAILTHGQNTGRAEALLDFLTSPLARRRFRSCGFSGIRPRRS